MIHEVSLYGVLIPDLLIWIPVAVLVGAPVRWILASVGFYHLVWHRALFDAALFVLILGGVVAVAQRVLT